MTLYEFREEYPEYDDMPDKLVKKLLKDAGTEVEPDDDDLILPTLQGIEEAVRAITFPPIPDFPDQDNSEIVAKLGSIEAGLKAVEVAIKALKLTATAPVVNVPAPVVNIPATPQVVAKPAKVEWTFDVVRDKSGFISEIKAR